MLCKYYLQLGCYEIDTESPDCLDVSNMIKNLDSIKVSYARVDLGGVVRKCGSSLEFTGKAYDAIIAHYEENYLQSKGVFAVYMADNNWVYSKAWECPLDFSTLQYDANVVTIGCVDNSVAAIIKANKKSKYEFNVSDLKDSANLLYNGVVTRRSFTFMVTGATPTGESTTDMVSSTNIEVTNNNYYSLYIPYIGVSADDFVSEHITCYDQQEYSSWSTAARGKDDGALMKGAMDADRAGFITCLQDCIVHIDMDMQFRFIYPSWWSQRAMKAYFILVVGSTVVWRKEVTDYNSVDVSIHGDFAMTTGQKMAFGMSVLSKRTNNNWMGTPMPDGSSNPNTPLIFNPGLRWGSNSNTAFVNESHYETEHIEINVVRPLSLLQNLIDKMLATREDICVVGRIEEGETLLPNTLLVAAESIRKITTNKLYSSFVQFCDFMEAVFGYVYTLEHVGYYMDKELVKIDNGEASELSHIRLANLSSPNWRGKEDRTEGSYKMHIIYGIISDDLGDALDVSTVKEYGVYHSLVKVYYYEPGNMFVCYDDDDNKFYTHWAGEDVWSPSDILNDENGHAKEMIGLRMGYASGPGTWKWGIIRNGRLIQTDMEHPTEWLDCAENNQQCTELAFKHRSGVFAPRTIKSLLNVNNLSFQFDESKVFSDVEVGYAKQDYDNSNSGFNEFNFTNYYKTDSDLTEQTMSLICPYRADCYGIEELLVKSNNSESTDSDNDIFIVIASASQPEDGHWQIDRSIEVQNAYSETVFNAAIAPNKIVRNNEEYIGSCVKRLKFTSSDGNSSAIIGGTSMHANINITKQLFKVGKISIDTDDHCFPETWDGLIEFAYAGKTYKGYLDSIDICFANMGTITYNIIEKCIE